MRFSSPAAAVVAALAFAAPAQADSISYVKNGDIWLSTPDGARQFQVTAGGGYTFASQADNGVIVATKGRKLFRLARTGEVLNEITTALGPIWYGPYEADVSPDGTKVAYELWDSDGYRSITYADTDNRGTDYPLHTGWGFPTWIDDGRLLHSRAPNALAMDLIVRGPSQPNNQGTVWYKLAARSPLLDVAIKGNAFAGIAGEDQQLLTVFRFTGEPGTGSPEPCYEFSQPVGKFEGPSFSPDGRRLAWAEGDGIWIADVPDLSGGCKLGPSGKLVLAGARHADWGPADVPAPRQVPPPPPPAGPAPAPPAPAPAPVAETLTLTPVKTSLRKALAKGFTVKLANASGKVRVTAAHKGKTVASGRGSRTVRLKFTKKAARQFRAKRSLKLTLKAPGAGATLTLKR